MGKIFEYFANPGERIGRFIDRIPMPIPECPEWLGYSIVKGMVVSGSVWAGYEVAQKDYVGVLGAVSLTAMGLFLDAAREIITKRFPKNQSREDNLERLVDKPN